MAGHQPQQLGGRRQRSVQLVAVQRVKRGLGVAHQRIHQRFTGFRVVPVARRFAQGGVVVVAGQRRAHRARQLRVGLVGGGEHFADRRAQRDHRVLGGHRIKQRRGINHPAAPPQQPRRPRGGVDILEQPPRPIRGTQPVAHPDQHRGVKRSRPHRQPGGGFPAQVKCQPVTGLPIRESLVGLQQHHRGHHPRRHRRASQRRAFEQVGEVLIAEQRITVLGQQPKYAALHQLITHQQHHVIESALPILTS